MGRLHEAAALEKDATTRVQTRLLKQVDTIRKSQSPRTAEERARAPPLPQLDREAAKLLAARSATGLRLAMMTSAPRNLKFPRIEDIADLAQNRIDQASQQTPKGLELTG